jgi:peptidoglycan/LPS O-acetylase OafA/YrhL
MTTNLGAKPANGRPVHIPYLDPFRGLAIIMIMLTHFPAPKWAFNLVSQGTIFFVFIAGFLMTHLYREATSVSSFWSQKIKRIILPYLIAATPGIAEMLLRKYDLVGSNYLIRTLSTGLGHRNDAHWFIPLIVLVFALYPLWRMLLRNSSVLGSVALGLIGLSLFTFRSAHNTLINLVHFSPIFILGMATAQHRVRLENFGDRHFWPVVSGSVGLAVILGWYSWLSEVPTMEEIWANYAVVLNFHVAAKLALVPALLLGFKRLIAAGWKFAPLTFLAKLSFGLFFWHLYVIKLLNWVFPNYLASGGYGTLLILASQLILVLAILVPGLLLIRKVVGPKSVMITGY